MKNEEKDLLRKLLHDSITEEERTRLNESETVSSFMRRQWKTSDGSLAANEVKEDTVWKKINRRLDNFPSRRAYLLYKTTSIAAAVALIIGIGYLFYFQDNLSKVRNPTMYVVHTGQNMEIVQLPDNSIVRMGPRSTLTYPGSFTGSERVVKLSGQGFFEVAKNREKPFIVQSDCMNVTALGTAFEIFNPTNRPEAETTLLNGKVKVELFAGNDANAREVILTPNQKLIMSRTDKTMRVESVDAERSLAWHKDGVIYFNQETLKNILPRLEQWYGKKIICKGKSADNYRFTFRVNDDSLDNILSFISKSSKITYTKYGESYTLNLE